MKAAENRSDSPTAAVLSANKLDKNATGKAFPLKFDIERRTNLPTNTHMAILQILIKKRRSIKTRVIVIKKSNNRNPD